MRVERSGEVRLDEDDIRKSRNCVRNGYVTGMLPRVKENGRDKKSSWRMEK